MQTPAWAKFVIDYIAKKRNFVVGPRKDLVQGSPITNYAEMQKYYNSYRITPNKTQIGVLFCG